MQLNCIELYCHAIQGNSFHTVTILLPNWPNCLDAFLDGGSLFSVQSILNIRTQSTARLEHGQLSAFGPKSGLNKDHNWFIDSLNMPYFVIRRHLRLLARKSL